MTSPNPPEYEEVARNLDRYVRVFRTYNARRVVGWHWKRADRDIEPADLENVFATREEALDAGTEAAVERLIRENQEKARGRDR